MLQAICVTNYRNPLNMTPSGLIYCEYTSINVIARLKTYRFGAKRKGLFIHPFFLARRLMELSCRDVAIDTNNI